MAWKNKAVIKPVEVTGNKIARKGQKEAFMKKKWIVIALAVYTIVLAGCKVVSEPEPIAVESVTLDATTLTLAPGATKKLTATVKPDNADDKTVRWSSSDTTVAMVNSDGTVGAIKAGTAIITAQAGGKSATCQITVKVDTVNPELVAVENVTLDAETLVLAYGEKATLTATVTPDNANDKTVKWSSSNTTVATVVDGAVTAVAEGTATIIAQAGDKTATCEVTVKSVLVAVEVITLDKDTLTLEVGKTGKLTVTVTPDNADNKIVKWSSSDTAVATVGDDGTVTAVKAGTATITARAGSKAAICTATVKSQEIATHVHYYSLGICTVCGFQKPFMLDGTIDDNGVLTNYRGAEATVTIPDGVIGIGSGAFENCGSLKKVVIPGSVTAIGSQAFKSCSNLNTVEMSAGLTGIGSYAFSECTSLRNVSIPTSVTSIGDDAFKKCESLVTVRYSGTLAQWCTQVCDYNLMSYAKSVILTGENDLDLKAVTALTIPDGVTSIGDDVFNKCSSLVSVDIPDSVTRIISGAFYGCENLATVRYNGTLAQWCVLEGNGGLTSYAKHIIMSDGTDLNSMTNLVIPDGVKSIGGAFAGCTSITSVIIPNSVKSIEKYAFAGCMGLESVSIPNSVTSIGLGAFVRCTSLTSVDIPCSVTSIEMGAFYECTSLTSVSIPSSVTSIGDSAFCMCRNLTSVDIPASVMKIGQSAFSGCNKLNSVKYDGTEEQWKGIEKGSGIFSYTTFKTITGKDGTTWTAQ